MSDFNNLDRSLKLLGDLSLSVAGISIGIPISNDELEKVIHASGVQLTNPIKKWSCSVNGFSTVHSEVYSIGPSDHHKNSLARYKDQHRSYSSKGLFPIGGDYSGNDYVIDFSGKYAAPNSILYTEGSEEWTPQFAIASCFETFIRFIIANELNDNIPWPLNREYVLKHDPDIVKCGFPLPWVV